jgi:hypothetical protein
MRRHRCDLRPVDVQHREQMRPGAVFGRPAEQTLVLRRCKGCGDLDTIELEGTWTLEQVCGGRLSAVTLPMAAVPGGGHVYRAPEPADERERMTAD